MRKLTFHSHWHLSLFPYRDLRPTKPLEAFCTSLPPELELEAEPITNRKLKVWSTVPPAGLAVLTYLTN